MRLGGKDWVYVLRKALYELLQASCEWHLTLHKSYMDHGFEQSRADSMLCVWTRNESFVIIDVYVNDILMSSNSNKSPDFLIDYIKKFFGVRVRAKIRKFLGFSIYDCGTLIHLRNEPMITRMLNEYRMEDCKAEDTPLFQGLFLVNDRSEELTYKTPYRQLIGSML